ncbi:bifunctional glutathione transferase/peroxidase [Conoideocrella luteorostrata]|uniref:Bifunctional glutathione transferase/peroxidase n=1 Tax=Conoideocrella luteorostrata TaxID=1105319 RepID=A0AAJ0FS41_9HYPO|nr:bifunctional glutathione transferase/peroxidase [Conoideocrella luteorostrata]
MPASEHPKIKLYWLSQSRSQRIIWLLEELKVPYELEVFHRDENTLMAPRELEKVHALGKSPIISITPTGKDAKPIILAESGFIAQYLLDHTSEGQNLMPKKWQDGKENTIAGETEDWLRYAYYMHYAEGSLMPYLVFALVISRLKSPQVPFLIRPITSIIANRIIGMFLYPNVKKHLSFINDQLASSTGKYLCGKTLCAADILMSFPLIAGDGRFNELGSWKDGSWRSEFPKVWEYVQLLLAEPGYKKSVAKVEEIDGKFEASL